MDKMLDKHYLKPGAKISNIVEPTNVVQQNYVRTLTQA